MKAMGIDLTKLISGLLKIIKDSPTLGAWGLGWEVWLDGMEITDLPISSSVVNELDQFLLS